MTDTTTLAPTDAEILNEWDRVSCITFAGQRRLAFARAVLAKWGAPAPASGEDVSPFGYFRAEPFGWTDCAESDEGAKPLYEKPPAQEARVPLLPNQRGLIALTADSISDAIDMTEIAHGITAAQKEAP